MPAYIILLPPLFLQLALRVVSKLLYTIWWILEFGFSLSLMSIEFCFTCLS